MKEHKLLRLLLTFLKIGAFTFGGGYAMIPVIQREIVEKRGWMPQEELLDVIAIAESTPGPIAVNAATFVGYRAAGFFGALLATLGVVFPAFCIIYIISFFLHQFEQLKAVKYAFMGIRAGVLSLLIKALFSMGKQCPRNVLAYLLVGLSFTAVAVFNVDVIAVLVSCALIGVICAALATKRDVR